MDLSDDSSNVSQQDDEVEVPHTSEEIERVFDGLSIDESRVIYHYCSADTLIEILKNKTIRMGESSKMNDGEEIVWTKSLIEDVVKSLHDRDDIPEEYATIPKSFLDRFSTSYLENDHVTRHFIASFSLDGDSLSQWRAYADNARGFSIGFETNCLEVPAPRRRVEYDLEEQKLYLFRAIAKLHELSKSDAYTDLNFEVDSFFIYAQSAFFKNPAFADEREVRLHHVSMFLQDERSTHPRFHYTGGFVGGESVSGMEFSFRTRNGYLVPYIDFPFQRSEPCGIKEIWLGPRNPNSEQDLEVMLGSMGYSDITIRRAGSAYRG